MSNDGLGTFLVKAAVLGGFIYWCESSKAKRETATTNRNLNAENEGDHVLENDPQLEKCDNEQEEDGPELETFLCPITQETIKQPATTCYGHLYELSAIKQWVQMKGKCPLTQKPLRMNQIFPQYSLKTSIKEMRKISKENEEQKEEIEKLKAQLGGKKIYAAQLSDLSVNAMEEEKKEAAP